MPSCSRTPISTTAGTFPLSSRTDSHGPIYSTPATTDLCNRMLRDSAHIQEKDAEFVEKRLRRRRAFDPGARDGDMPRSMPQKMPRRRSRCSAPSRSRHTGDRSRRRIPGLRRGPHSRLVLPWSSPSRPARNGPARIFRRRRPARASPSSAIPNECPRSITSSSRAPTAAGCTSTSASSTKLADVVTRTARARRQDHRARLRRRPHAATRAAAAPALQREAHSEPFRSLSTARWPSM